MSNAEELRTDAPASDGPSHDDRPHPDLPYHDLPGPPQTGDATVDAALERLHAAATSGTFDEQADAGEAAHRVLQDRMSDLGGG